MNDDDIDDTEESFVDKCSEEERGERVMNLSLCLRTMWMTSLQCG